MGSVRIGKGALGFQLAVVFGAATLSNGATALGSRTATCGSRAAGLYAPPVMSLPARSTLRSSVTSERMKL